MKIPTTNLIRSRIAEVHKHPFFRPLAVYLLMFAALEILADLISPAAGLVGQGIMLLILLNQAIFTQVPKWEKFTAVLALVPLLRILSLAAPILPFPLTYMPILAGLPLLLGIYAVAQYLDAVPRKLQIKRNKIGAQIAFCLCGIPLSLVNFYILKPEPLLSQAVWWQLSLTCLAVFIFSALPEEIIFRGLLLQLFGKKSPLFGLMFSSLLYFIISLASGSFAFALIMGVVGLLFGLWVQRHQTLWEVILANGFITVGTWIVWPLLLG